MGISLIIVLSLTEYICDEVNIHFPVGGIDSLGLGRFLHLYEVFLHLFQLLLLLAIGLLLLEELNEHLECVHNARVDVRGGTGGLQIGLKGLHLNILAVIFVHELEILIDLLERLLRHLGEPLLGTVPLLRVLPLLPCAL